MVQNQIPSDGVLENMGYRELQIMAKSHGISGKQSGAAIMSELREKRDEMKARGRTKSTRKSKKGTTPKRRGSVTSKLSQESQTPQRVTRSATRKNEIEEKEGEPKPCCCFTGDSLLYLIVALLASMLVMRCEVCAELKEALKSMCEKLWSAGKFKNKKQNVSIRIISSYQYKLSMGSRGRPCDLGLPPKVA